MFRKLKEKLADEVKQNPRLQGTLDSVNQLAVQTYASFKEGSGSRDSLTSLTSTLSGHGQNGGSSQSDILSSVTSPTSTANLTVASVSSNSGQFFSLGEDDDPVSFSNSSSPTKTPTPASTAEGSAMTSTPMTKARRLSTSSQQDASLFPIWEDPGRENVPLFSDMESCAGSEAGWDDSGSAQLGAVTKEQLYTMLAKMRARYHKYKGRYTDLAKAYRDLEGENRKVKEVMQQTQDRALRRIGELREQAALEKQAKAHLEEELRAELEEKEHVIVTLNTKVALLKETTPTPESKNGQLVDLSPDTGHQLVEDGDKKEVEVVEGEVKHGEMEEKVRRLESLLSKCKENIKANKQKTIALTEVKEQLAIDLEAKEKELNEQKERGSKMETELEQLRGREAGEELQMAEIKMAMHKEMLDKDEEIITLRGNMSNLTGEKDLLVQEVSSLKQEIVQMGSAQDALERRMEEERKAAMEELSRGKEAALEQERERLREQHKAEVIRELSRAEEEWGRKVKEVEEEGRLGREELELRLAAASKPEDGVKVRSLQEEVGRLRYEAENQEARLQNSKAERIVLEDKMKQALATKEDLVHNLEEEVAKLTRTVEEKQNEVSSCLDSMTKMEKAIKDEKANVESVEKQLQHAIEEHRHNLENLKAVVEKDKDSSEIEVLRETHRTEISKKDAEIKKLAESASLLEETTKELQERLDINLDSSLKNDEEHELKISNLEKNIEILETNLKECEENLSGKAEELRDANEKVEDLQNCLEQMQNSEARLKEAKDLLDQKSLELRDANEELEEFKRIADERGNSKVDLEKELIGLREQVNARQALHDQMVGYEKELQSRISDLENEKIQLKSSNETLEKDLESKVQEIENMQKTNEEEKVKQKQDREMKIRLEREKENAHKEFQLQSIEYEKKLQDQLEENNIQIGELKKEILNGKKEAAALEASYEKEIGNLETRLTVLLEKFNMTNNMSNNMSEKCDIVENILEGKEKLVEKLEKEKEEFIYKIKELEEIKSNFAEERKRLNKIIEESQEQLEKIKGDCQGLTKIQLENKKLSKSRDRLKSLLDEKEKNLSDLQGEKEKVEGSREEVDQKMKERLSTLAEEIAKTNELKESLQCEVSELKNQLEIVSREVEDKNTRNEILLKELEILQKSSDDVIKEKESISDEKQSIQKELKETFSKLENSFGEIKQLEQTILDTSQHKSELAKALSDLKISREESDNLKIKVKQIESLNVTELKEENAILNERLSQFEDEKIELMSSFEKCREEKETLELVQLEEKKTFENRISSLEEEVKKQGSFHLTEDTEAKIKSLAKEMERKMARMETEHEEELERLRDVQEIEMGRLNREHKELVGRLNSDLRSMVEQLEVQEQEKEAALRMGAEEAKEQFEVYEAKQKKLASQVEELQNQIKLEKSRGDWGWEDGDSSIHQMDGDSPAIFGVPHPAPHPVQSREVPVSLEEYPEFEYLRNILFQYMCGNQPHILVKVLSAIVKFSPDQVSEIMKSEERKQGYLTSLGLS